MTAKELTDFYKKHPDYGNNRIGLDYSKYVEGDWVVLRGEYKDKKTGEGIPGKKVTFLVSHDLCNGDGCISVTDSDGVFNLELPKSKITDTYSYRIEMHIDHYKVSQDLGGKVLKADSIYHFKVLKDSVDNENFSLQMEPIHNKIFSDALTYEEREVKIPSWF